MKTNGYSFALSPERITEVLERAKTIVVCGVSEEPGSWSLAVTRFLREAGYTVFAMNGTRLLNVPGHIDLVVIFPTTRHLQQVVEDAMTRHVPAVWFQKGVRSRALAERLAKSGVDVVFDACIRSEHRTRWPSVGSLYSDVGPVD